MAGNSDYLIKTKEYYNRRFKNEKNSPELNMEAWFRWEAIEKQIIKHSGKDNANRISILDYGCGTGWLSNLLSKHGEVTGVDISENAILQASKKYSGIRFLTMDASSSEFEKLKGQLFDVIVSSEVIEHIEDQEAYLKNMLSLLKKNGTLILTTPNGKWFKHYFFGERADWGQPFEFWLTADKLKGLAAPYLNSLKISSFYCDGLLPLKSYGTLNFLGNRFILSFFRLIKLDKLYYLLLDKAGFGLYLILTGIKNAN